MTAILRFLALMLFLSLAHAEEGGLILLGEEQLLRYSGERGESTIGHTEWRYTDVKGQSVGLHRYRVPGIPTRAVLLYLPGTNMNGVIKTLDEKQNLWIYLAARGVEVFTVDYRTRFLAPDYAGSLEFMRDWTINRFVKDIVMGYNKVRDTVPGKQVFIAGFSRGASYAYLLAGQVQVDGVIALDGSFKRVPYRGYNLGAAMERFDQENRPASVLSRRGFESRDTMMRAVLVDPSGPASDKRYATAAEQLSEVLYNAWGPGVLANTREHVSSIETLAREMRAYDWFFPNIQTVESQSMAAQADDPSTSLDDHFGKLNIPVFYIGAGKFGAESLVAGIHSAAGLAKGRPRIEVLEMYGHLDVLFSQTAVEDVYSKVYAWLDQFIQ